MPLSIILLALVIVLIVVSGVVLGFLLNAIIAPFRCRLNQWQSAESRFEPCEESELAPTLAPLIANLGDLGFVLRGHWQLTGHSRASGQITLMEHPRTLDVAKVVVVAADSRKQVTLGFQTRYEDGTEIVTANNQLTVGLPQLPEVTYLWLPEVRGAGQLYRVHTQARDHLELDKKRLPIRPRCRRLLN